MRYRIGNDDAAADDDTKDKYSGVPLTILQSHLIIERVTTKDKSKKMKKQWSGTDTIKFHVLP